MAALTSDIAAFVTSVAADALPERCSYGARIGMIDCVGVMIAGAGEPAVQLIAATVAASTQNEGAPEIPSGRNLAATDAALVNGELPTRSTTTMWAWMGIPVPCSRRPSWPRAGRWALAVTRRSQPTQRVTRSGRCYRKSSPATCMSADSIQRRSGALLLPRRHAHVSIG